MNVIPAPGVVGLSLFPPSPPWTEEEGTGTIEGGGRVRTVAALEERRDRPEGRVGSRCSVLDIDPARKKG